MPEKRPPGLTSEEWRTLMITFVGGVASIVVGAAILGVALALGHLQTRYGDFVTWVTLTIASLLGCGYLVLLVLWNKDMPKGKFGMIIAISAAFAGVFSVLVLIGKAAGIK